MQLPLGVVVGVARSAVETHRVGEWSVEDAVVACSNRLQNGCEPVASGWVELGKGTDMSAWQQERLEWPHGPEGNEGDPGIVLGYDAFAQLQFQFEVVEQQRAMVLG